MNDWLNLEIGELLDGQWPGEWGTDPTPDLESIRVYRSTEIDNFGHIDEDGGVYRCIPMSQVVSKSLRPGDILLEASGGTPGRPVGRVGRYVGKHDEAAMCANFLRVLRPTKGVSSDFVRWALVHLHGQPEIWRFQQQTTGMSNLKVSDYLRHRIPVPGAEIQPKIAEILSMADEAIMQTEALIAKTQQIKAGLMHDLFTRGVTPNGQLRPSREEAPQLYKESPLGWIPKDWDVSPLEGLYRNPIRDFGSFSSTNLITFLDSGVPFIKSEMIGVGRIDWASVMYISKDVHVLLSKSHVHTGNILFSKIGSALGKAAVYDGDHGVCNSNAAVAKIEIDERKAGRHYVAHFLNHPLAKVQFRKMIISLLPRINLGDINRLSIPIPSRNEQGAVEELLASVDNLLVAEESNLLKMQAEKRGLMHDLLTGHTLVLATSHGNV